MVSDSKVWHNYRETGKQVDDFMTRIDFLESYENPNKGTEGSKKQIVRKTVKDVDQGVPLVILCEIANYRVLQHFNLDWVGPKFMGYDLTPESSELAQEIGPCVYMEAGTSDLQHFINQLAKNPAKRLEYADHVIKSCVMCLAACHSLGFIYSDPKPQNFLVYFMPSTSNTSDLSNSKIADNSKPSDNPYPKISLCDFGYTSPHGLARYNDDYRPPEVWITGKATVKADIWALGLTLLKYIIADSFDISTVFNAINDKEDFARYLKSQDDFCLSTNMIKKLHTCVFLPSLPKKGQKELGGTEEELETEKTGKDLLKESKQIEKFQEMNQTIFQMLRYNPSERKMPYFMEMESLPKIKPNKKTFLEFSDEIFMRFIQKKKEFTTDQERQKVFKIASQTIAEKWYKGECAFEEIADSNKIGMEKLEEAEKQIIETLDGLIYLPIIH